MMIQAPALPELTGIRHAFFTREGGVSTGIYESLNGGLGSADDPEHIAKNRRRMAETMGVHSEALLSLYQIHSAEVVVAERPWTGDRPRADAMVTRVPGLALGISTADCGPLLFADAEAGVVGAAHAGWKGALSGILEATLASMEGLGARRERTTIVLGPTIGPQAYEVGPEFVARFREADPENIRFFRESGREAHAFFDLPAFIGMRARAAGASAFVDLALCTYSDEQRFFSYRRATHRGEPDYGRLIAAIALRG